MKKNLLYLLALVSIAFASCDPLEDTITEIAPNKVYTKSLAVTLVPLDYALLPTSNYANKAGYFNTVADANAAIPVILNAKFSQLDNGSIANITYNALPPQIKPADSVLANVTYAVSDADYAAVNGSTFKNFSAAKALEFLTYKYPTAVEKQLKVINYTYYESGTTTSAGIPASDSFLYLNGAWSKIYQVTPAQYASVGKGSYFNFAAADDANLTGFFNSFLKADGIVSATAKVGDIKYVSFAYYNSSTKVNSQRVRTLTFDGTNWAYKSIQNTLTFLKKDDKWNVDPTQYYTLIAADYVTIGSAANVGNATNRANLAQYKNFNQTAGQPTTWTDADIQAGLIVILNAKYPNAATDPTVKYKITYYVYTGSYAYLTMTFVKSANGFTFLSKP